MGFPGKFSQIAWPILKDYFSDIEQNYGTSGASPYSDGITDFITGLNTAITDVQTDGNFTAYLNYLDPMLTKEEAQDLYYGADLASKLLTIKNEVDPDCVFWNPQAICAN